MDAEVCEVPNVLDPEPDGCPEQYACDDCKRWTCVCCQDCEQPPWSEHHKQRCMAGVMVNGR